MKTHAEKPFKQYDGTYLLLQKPARTSNSMNYIHLIGAWSLAFAFNVFMCKVAPIVKWTFRPNVDFNDFRRDKSIQRVNIYVCGEFEKNRSRPYF